VAAFALSRGPLPDQPTVPQPREDG
jgi:hypothetical protein